MKGSGNALMAPMKIVDLHDWMLGLPHAQDIHIITIIHKRLVESNSNSITIIPKHTEVAVLHACLGVSARCSSLN